jgi:hypothetical protein
MTRRGPLLVVVTGVLLLAALALPIVAKALVGQTAQQAVQPDGRVSAIAVSGTTIYIGGQFTHVKDLGGVSQARAHLAAVDAATGSLLPWAPSTDLPVDALAVSPAGTVYVGGEFTTVNGVARSRLAAVDGVSGALGAWNPGADATVRALAVSGVNGRLYAGGDFKNVAGAARTRLAAFSLSSGSLDSAWKPKATGAVNSLALAPDGSRVYAGGSFKSLNGSGAAAFAAAIDPASGALDAGFTADWGGKPGFKLYALAADADGLYAAGGGTGGHLVWWNSDGSLHQPIYLTDGGVQAVSALGDSIYAGGHFKNYCVGNTGSGSPEVCDTPLLRQKLFSVSKADGSVNGWAPKANSALGVWSMAAVPAAGKLAVGGDFTKINGKPQAHFALFG